MVKATGENLSVLIMSDPTKDWETFVTWYSLLKNLPYAKVVIYIQRNGEIPFRFFQWAKRLLIPCVQRSPFSHTSEYANRLNAIKVCKEANHLTDEILLVTPYMISLDSFDTQTLENLNSKNVIINDSLWFLRNPDIDQAIDSYYMENKMLENSECIYSDVKESQIPVCFGSYEKGVGRWINTSRGCPLANAAGLVSVDMTVNEHKVIDLWKKMASLYSVIV